MTDESSTVDMATELTIAWLSNPNTRATNENVPAFLQSMHEALSTLGSPGSAKEDLLSESRQFTPAVTVRKSLASPDHIISMIDGKPYRSLKRHLSSQGLTPNEYRQRYGLKADYPMVAPGYSERRRDLAKKLDLGRKPAAAKALPADVEG